MAEGSFTLEMITPDNVFFVGAVDMVELNTTEGELGILPGHIPVTAILQPGMVTIYEPDGTEKSAVIRDGFVEILQDKVTILTEGAEWQENRDITHK